MMELNITTDAGLALPPLALGTWAMGGEPRVWGVVDDRESIATVEQAIDCGMTLLDTAPIYGRGHSEEIVGQAIRGRRDEVLIATKCGLLFPHDGDALPPRCLKRDSILQECDASLRRMRIDTIDLYQCHWPDPDTPIEETMEALLHLRERGKIRAIGLCNFSCDQISRARRVGPVHAVQTPFSLLNRRASEDLIPYCQEYGIAVLPYGTLGKGLLTGKFSPESAFADLRASDPDFLGERFRRNLRLVEALRPLAKRYGKTLAQLSINWVASHPGVTTPIVGAKRASQVLENAGGVGWSLSDEDRDRIDALLRQVES
ncbi:MAG: aldo/keto reductase [Planctomycetota bacterium]|nr:MAG: aldo/keto reductase [Planctomycetota bacterium]